ncbi:MAG: GxxExxY protein [Flavobacterium sp.]|nr:GxxExxY protein [Flavobacterium sp.]
METELLFKDLTDIVIRCFYDVYNELGYGFLENVYQNAMAYELRSHGLTVDTQRKIAVTYKDVTVGNYISDIIVNDKVILELKACDMINIDHQYQLINYLKSTDCEVGLLLNFGKKPQFMRKVFENYRK